MPCGPVSGGPTGRGGEGAADAFSFGPGGAAVQSMMTLAMMWAAPWRAVAVVAEEAVRESIPRRD